MADAFTSKLNMTLPEIGGSDDTWGDKLNDNFDILDALFGVTGEGTVIVRDANNDALASGVNITKAAGNERRVNFKTGASPRWVVGANGALETGGNAGSDFVFYRFNDAGAFQGNPIVIERVDGKVTFETTPKVGANAILHQGNLSNIAVPIGTPIPWLLDTLPSAGYLWMNGGTASRTSFPLLFALWGTKFGVGDGATTFGLPDWREVVPVGKSTMGGVGARGLITHYALTDTAAAPIGEAKHTMSAAEHAAHVHAVFAGVETHTHNMPLPQQGTVIGSPVTASLFTGQNSSSPTTLNVFSGASATGLTVRDTAGGGGTANQTAAQGNATPFNVVQPGVVCCWAVKAAA